MLPAQPAAPKVGPVQVYWVVGEVSGTSKLNATTPVVAPCGHGVMLVFPECDAPVRPVADTATMATLMAFGGGGAYVNGHGSVAAAHEAGWVG